MSTTKIDVLDMLIESLLEHEQNLDKLVERLERATDRVLKDWK